MDASNGLGKVVGMCKLRLGDRNKPYLGNINTMLRSSKHAVVASMVFTPASKYLQQWLSGAWRWFELILEASGTAAVIGNTDGNFNRTTDSSNQLWHLVITGFALPSIVRLAGWQARHAQNLENAWKNQESWDHKASTKHCYVMEWGLRPNLPSSFHESNTEYFGYRASGHTIRCQVATAR